jgi:putative two-component system response regulator
MAVADVYDALISERPYKKAFSHEKAVEIIASESGRHFDPELAQVFLECAEEFRAISER